MNITLPDFSLILLVGAPSAGKSSFAKKHFLPSEILSSDFCRLLVSDDENNMAASESAFEVLHHILHKRLAAKRLTVIDATNLQEAARRNLLNIAKEHHCLSVAIVLNPPKAICLARNEIRTDRNLREQALNNQFSQMRRALKELKKERYHARHFLDSVEEIEQVVISRKKLWTDKSEETGPFDIIGDIHGCYEELRELLEKLGYCFLDKHQVIAPEGRKVVFLGDLVDRGPAVPDVLRLVMDMVKKGQALCVPGNHEVKLVNKLQGKNVEPKHGLKETLEQLAQEPSEFIQEIIQFINSLVSHYVLDQGKLVVAHAGIKEAYQGRTSGRVRAFALYGDVTGEIDSFGLPVRLNWAEEYRGKALVVYGHTPVPQAEWLNNTIDIDTGCVFGGSLTALRYPERELISVPAKKTYAESSKPLIDTSIGIDRELSLQHLSDGIIDIKDVLGRELGKHLIFTKYAGQVTLREENTRSALEIMSRFAVHPKWLIYLPPTMSPTESSFYENYLEFPEEAFRYYESNEISEIICEEKHMGSRVIVIVCRDHEAVRSRFGITHETEDCIGICYTRTGRRFFEENSELEKELLLRLQKSMEQSGFWDKFQTDWACFDCELIPWSAKAQQLVKDQYASVATAATHSLNYAYEQLLLASQANEEIKKLSNKYRERCEMAHQFTQAYRNYCWPVNSVEDLKLAPFHLLATESAVHTDKTHLWHLQEIAELCKLDPKILHQTNYRVVQLDNSQSTQEAIEWWMKLTKDGGEGIVVKPMQYCTSNSEGLLQPAIKCRGQEYLRIIYGMEYTFPHEMAALRKQRNVKGKRRLALREFALGVEALERFVKKEPLRRVHECVFGILALESESIDPRL